MSEAQNSDRGDRFARLLQECANQGGLPAQNMFIFQLIFAELERIRNTQTDTHNDIGRISRENARSNGRMQIIAVIGTLFSGLLSSISAGLVVYYLTH